VGHRRSISRPPPLTRLERCCSSSSFGAGMRQFLFRFRQHHRLWFIGTEGPNCLNFGNNVACIINKLDWSGGGIRIDSYLVNLHGGRIFRLVYTPISTPFQQVASGFVYRGPLTSASSVSRLPYIVLSISYRPLETAKPRGNTPKTNI